MGNQAEIAVWGQTNKIRGKRHPDTIEVTIQQHFRIHREVIQILAESICSFIWVKFHLFSTLIFSLPTTNTWLAEPHSPQNPHPFFPKEKHTPLAIRWVVRPPIFLDKLQSIGFKFDPTTVDRVCGQFISQGIHCHTGMHWLPRLSRYATLDPYNLFQSLGKYISKQLKKH